MFNSFQRRSTMDQPECYGNIRYLTTVAPHRITRDPQIVDVYVREAIRDLWGEEVLESFHGYTRSFYSLEGHYQNLWNYGTPHSLRPPFTEYERALEITRDAFKLDEPVQSYGWDQLNLVPFIASSSAGYGYTGKKGDFDNHEIAIKRAVYSLNAWIETKENRATHVFKYTPHLAWTRTQLGTFENPKIRHVWGEAFHNIILEGMSAVPLIDAYSMKGDPMAIGIQMYHQLPPMIHSVLGTADERFIGVGTDIKNFDSSIRPWMINDSFDIIRENLKFPDIMSERAFEYSRAHFIKKPLVMPDGRMWMVDTGVPSGSYFTQLIDSVANYIATTYAQLRVFNRNYKLFVLGDDSIFGIPESVYLNNTDFLTSMGYAYEELGMTLNVDKSIIATNARQLEFLGHTTRGLTVDRDLTKLMRLALYSEQPVTRPSVSLSRIKGIMIDSALQHQPLITLYRYMQSLYNQEEMTFPTEDANWITSVLRYKGTPSNLDLMKIWCLT